MSEATALICNRQKEIVYVIKDFLCLFHDGSKMVFEKIIAEKSIFKLSQFFSTVEEHTIAYNCQIRLKQSGLDPLVYFSGIFWAEMYIIKITKSKLEVTLSLINPQPAQKKIAVCSSVLEQRYISGKASCLINQHHPLNDNQVERLQDAFLELHETKSYAEKPEQLATTDSLTGLLNRTSIINYAKAEVICAGRAQKLLGLAIMSIDNLKQINDTFGLQVGNKVVKRFAYCLTKSTREYDAVGRIGDAEFLLFFKINSVADFVKLNERLLESLKHNKVAMPNGMTEQLIATTSAIYFYPHTSQGILIDEVLRCAGVELMKASQKKEMHLIITKYGSETFVK